MRLLVGKLLALAIVFIIMVSFGLQMSAAIDEAKPVVDPAASFMLSLIRVVVFATLALGFAKFTYLLLSWGQEEKEGDSDEQDGN